MGGVVHCSCVHTHIAYAIYTLNVEPLPSGLPDQLGRDLADQETQRWNAGANAQEGGND